MHIVIVGGGFGGVKAALELSKRHVGRITLISDRPYFLHHATLYATATGKSTEESVIPLATLFAHHPSVNIVEDTITSIDPSRKLVSSSKRDYHYDKAIFALGSTTSFRGVRGLERHGYGIKTLEDVREFQEHIHDEVVRQRLDQEYFVIGAGLSGVELSSALTEHLASLKSIYRLSKARPKVTLVEMEPRILPRLSRSSSRIIRNHLQKIGVKVIVNQKVTSLTDSKITIGGRVYTTAAALWTSGLTNNPFYAANSSSFELNPDGKVVVSPFLEAVDDVYVIGDNNDAEYNGTALSATKQATRVAKNIARFGSYRIQKRFRPTKTPISLPVGSHWGYFEWRGLYIAGRLGLTIRRLMELHSYCQLMPLRIALPIWRSHKVSDVDDLF